MRITIGSDHAGFRLKEHFIAVLKDDGHDVTDLGTDSEESVDYPIYCSRVGRAVAEHGHVPAPGLFEDRPLLGEHCGVEPVAHVDEVGRGRHRELGVHVADRGEEGVAEPGPVHGVVGALAALERPCQAPSAHRVGPPQQEGRDPGERFGVHWAQATDGV